MKRNKLITTGDGSNSLLSSRFGVSYHSKHGAIQEAYHVFINAALRFKAVLQRNIFILEIGFGTGLNAYVSFLEAKKRNLKIYYTGIDAFPISINTAQALNYTNLLYPQDTKDHFLKMHQAPWGKRIKFGSHFYLKKQLHLIEKIAFKNQFDIIYFDAFAPETQPELWTDKIFQKMFDALLPNGILVTYCAKGSVKRSMKKAGFTIEALKGPPGKREMTRALRLT